MGVGWVDWLGLFALLCGLALFAETFRPRPMWRNIRREPPGGSPSQRRWIGASVILTVSGMLLGGQLEGDTALWAVAFALPVAGLVPALMGAFRGPTEAEQRRRAEALHADGTDAS